MLFISEISVDQILRNYRFLKEGCRHIRLLKDHVTLKTGVMTAENSALPS